MLFRSHGTGIVQRREVRSEAGCALSEGYDLAGGGQIGASCGGALEGALERLLLSGISAWGRQIGRCVLSAESRHEALHPSEADNQSEKFGLHVRLLFEGVGLPPDGNSGLAGALVAVVAGLTVLCDGGGWF